MSDAKPCEHLDVMTGPVVRSEIDGQFGVLIELETCSHCGAWRVHRMLAGHPWHQRIERKP